MKVKLINRFNEDGTAKSKLQIEEETLILLNCYRRKIIVLKDEVFTLTQNIIPCKTAQITDLTSSLEEMTEDRNKWKSYYKNRGWFT